MEALAIRTENRPQPYAFVPAQNKTKYNELLKAAYTFSMDYFQLFLDSMDCKPTTMKGYKNCLAQFQIWLLNNVSDPQHPVQDDIKAYRDYLDERQDLSAGTRQQYVRMVKQFFAYLAPRGLYPNIGDGVRPVKIRHDIHRKDAFAENEVSKIIQTIDRTDIKGKRLYAMFLLAFVDGLRTIEIHRANIGNLEIIDGSLWLYIKGKGHDEADTEKSISRRTREALEEYLQARKDGEDPNSPLFTATGNRTAYDEKGEPTRRISTTSISKMLKGCFIAAGYDSPRLTAHSARHTAATTAMNGGGATIRETQELCGHQSSTVTEVYVHQNNHRTIEKKFRQRIEDAYFEGTKLNRIMPDLESEIMKLSDLEQMQLLEYLRSKNKPEQVL